MNQGRTRGTALWLVFGREKNKDNKALLFYNGEIKENIHNKEQIDRGLRRIAENIVQIFLPRRCPLCDTILREPQALICEKCRGELPWTAKAEAQCMKCSRPIEDVREAYCQACAKTEHAFEQAYAVFTYEKGMRESVLRMKFENRREYLDFYAQAMAEGSRVFLRTAKPQAVMPVPMYPAKVRRRGYDQCRLLAKKYAELTGLELITDRLVRVRDTQPQKGLTAADRVRNLRDAFAVRPPGQKRREYCQRVPSREALPQRVLLLDDIYTTGSTVDACSRALLAAGVEKVFVLALCIAR